MKTDKLVINWQNFARVRLQLKFALSRKFTRPILAQMLISLCFFLLLKIGISQNRLIIGLVYFLLKNKTNDQQRELSCSFRPTKTSIQCNVTFKQTNLGKGGVVEHFVSAKTLFVLKHYNIVNASITPPSLIMTYRV